MPEQARGTDALTERAEKWLVERESVVPNAQDFPEESRRYEEQTDTLRDLIARVQELEAENARLERLWDMSGTDALPIYIAKLEERAERKSDL